MRLLTLAYAAKGSLIIYVGTAHAPDDPEWEAYTELVKSVRLKWQRARIVVFTGRDAVAPNAVQRKRIAELNRLFRQDVVVISESLVARTAVTALRWLGVEIQAFAPSRQEEALQRLQLTADERSWLLESEPRLREGLRQKPEL